MLLQDFLEIISNDGINVSYLQKTMDEWQRFIDGQPVNTNIVPMEIFNSWRRCQSAGLDPFVIGPCLLNEPNKKEKADFHHLVQIRQKYEGFFEQAEELISDEFVILIGDINGIGDRQVDINRLFSFPHNKFIAVNCSELKVGTTSYSILLQEKKPVVVLKGQHYRQEFHDINDAAAPIYNEKNELIGVINVLFYDIKLAAKAFGLAQFFAKLFNILYPVFNNGSEAQLDQILDLLPHGIAIIDDQDGVKRYNHKLLDILGIKNNDQQKLWNKSIFKLGAGGPFTKKEVQLDINGKQVSTYATCRLLTNEQIGRTTKLLQLEQLGSKVETPTKNDGLEKLYTFADIIGNSTKIEEAKKLAMTVAKTSVPVLLYGENGSGKEMFAQAIHSASSRWDKPFIAINCGALPAEIVESELFGYEEGSFTGAVKGGKMGKIEAASGGTLFLDEIESMSLPDQIKLLRVLSTGKIQKVGGTKEIPLDFRLISASKKDLLNEADRGLFREDLFYRVSTFIINLPALDERRPDIDLLTQYFVAKFANKYSLANVAMDDEFREALKYNHWRGNVRELEHVLERAVIFLGSAQVLKLEHLPDRIQKDHQYKTTERIVQQAIERSERPQGLLSFTEEIVIKYVLMTVGGNVSLAAERLGVSPKTIYNKIKEHPCLRL